MVIAKKKGSNAERELTHKFWDNNIACARIAGSGSIKLPMPDIIAGKNKKILAIECKNVSGNSVYFKEYEINELEQFAIISGMMPFVAVKLNNKSWHFLHTNSLIKTEKAYVFNINTEETQNKLLSFEKIVNFLND